MDLRPYQSDSIERLRAGFRARTRRQVLSSPTGSGKTVIAMAMIQSAVAKGSRTLFIVDGIALLDQTSRRFHLHGLEHGLIGDGRYSGLAHPIVIAMVQTLIRRDDTDLTAFLGAFDVVFIDECHVLYKRFLDALETSGTRTVGLTATPFAASMGRVYDGLVQVATTTALLAEGHLAPLKIRVAQAIDMREKPLTSRGEWSADDVHDASRPIIGDIPTTWVAETTAAFGGPVKTMLFSASIAHGDEIRRAFQNIGVDARQVTAYDESDARERTMAAFRRGEFHVVISVAALGKGVDIPDVQCLVIARPLARSLMTHLQMLGRGMRTAPGKDACLVIDHSGNCAGFFEATETFFNAGATHLSDDSVRLARRETQGKRTAECHGCGAALSPGVPTCLACGLERKRRSNDVEHVPGRMIDLDDTARTRITVTDGDGRTWTGSGLELWRACCARARPFLARHGDVERARRMAVASYINLAGDYPPRGLAFDPAPRTPSVIKRRADADYREWKRRRIAA